MEREGEIEEEGNDRERGLGSSMVLCSSASKIIYQYRSWICTDWPQPGLSSQYLE